MKFQSQTPPPTLREVLGAYVSQDKEDREMLIALLKAKAAEDQRITSIASIQQQVVQMQLTILGVHIHHNLTQSMLNANRSGESQEVRKDAGQVERNNREERRSPVSPSPPYRHRLGTPVRLRVHPYAHARPVSRQEDQPLWSSRKSWDLSVSDERSTREEGASRLEY
jgi:hypothetical protein